MPVFKQEPIKEFKSVQEKLPDYGQKLLTFLENTIGESSLDPKTRELLLVGLLAAENFESGFKFHVKEALNCGATKKEILGAILLTMPYCGVATFLRSYSWANDVGIL